MTDNSARSSLALPLREWQELASGVASRLHAAGEELAAVFSDIAASARRSAAHAYDSVLVAELRQRPVPDLDELMVRLADRGPSTLSLREQRALLSAPSRLKASDLDALLSASPMLTRHAGRLCLMHWPRYVNEPWGAVYEEVLRSRPNPDARLLEVDIPLRSLLSRSAPSGDESIAAQLPTNSIGDAYERLRHGLGVRDSWLFSSSVLGAWLGLRACQGKLLDATLQSILGHERLRALMLPPPIASSGGLPVRTSIETQAQVVATVLDRAFSKPPLLQQKSLGAFIDYLLRSTFDDPRSALRSDGWTEVSRLKGAAFRRLLASLCEQDLEFFFQHAMNEPDRRRFWLAYLPEIARTGCVLDRDLHKRMNVRLQGQPELQSAIGRAFEFKSASDVQAFFLVFSTFVVVEFSHTGNAAYVYARDYFAKKLEPKIRAGGIDSASSLKLRRHADHRILHGGNWQSSAAEWLASAGVHARGSRFEHIETVTDGPSPSLRSDAVRARDRVSESSAIRRSSASSSKT